MIDFWECSKESYYSNHTFWARSVVLSAQTNFKFPLLVNAWLGCAPLDCSAVTLHAPHPFFSEPGFFFFSIFWNFWDFFEILKMVTSKWYQYFTNMWKIYRLHISIYSEYILALSRISTSKSTSIFNQFFSSPITLILWLLFTTSKLFFSTITFPSPYPSARLETHVTVSDISPRDS